MTYNIGDVYAHLKETVIIIGAILHKQLIIIYLRLNYSLFFRSSRTQKQSARLG